MNNPPSYLPAIPGGSVYPPRPMYGYPPTMAVPQQQFPDDDDSDSDDDPNNKKTKGKGGSSCHQCKSRRNFTALTYCTSLLDKKNKKCRKKFCGHCLKKFYKEQAAGPAEKQNWTCPSCRRICCCAACRRRKDKDDGSPVVGAVGVPKKRKKREDDSDDSDDDVEYSYSHSIPQMPHMGMNMGMNMGMGMNSMMPMSTPQSMVGAPMGMGMGMNMGMTQTSAVGKPLMAPKSEPRLLWSEDGSEPLDIAALAARYPTLVQEYVRRAALLAAQDPQNAFAQLYTYAQTPFVRQRIDMILRRPDMDKAAKVELIADILRTGSGAALHGAAVSAAPPTHAHPPRAMHAGAGVGDMSGMGVASMHAPAPMAMAMDRSVGRIPHHPAAVKTESPTPSTAATAAASAPVPSYPAALSRPGSSSVFPHFAHPHVPSPATPLAYLYGLSPPVAPRADLAALSALPALPALPGAHATAWQGLGLHGGVASALTPSVATHTRLTAAAMGLSPMLAPKQGNMGHGIISAATGIGHGLTSAHDSRTVAAAGMGMNGMGTGASAELSGALAGALKNEDAERVEEPVPSAAASMASDANACPPPTTPAATAPEPAALKAEHANGNV